MTTYSDIAPILKGIAQPEIPDVTMKSVPPLDEVFTMSGMQLPEILGKKADADKVE